MRYRITIPGHCSFTPKRTFVCYWEAWNYTQALLGEKFTEEVKIRVTI